VLHGALFWKEVHGHLSLDKDGGKDVIEVMGDPSGQGADGLHLLGLAKPSFKPPLFSDVFINDKLVSMTHGYRPEMYHLLRSVLTRHIKYPGPSLAGRRLLHVSNPG